MNFISPAIKRYMMWRISSINNFIQHPIDSQKEVFNDLISRAQYTEFGRKYDFENISFLRDFKKSVPIHEYEDIKPYIDRILHGEQNILWSSPITWFAQSSGTTSDKSKFIPVSQETLDDNHFRSGKDVLAIYLNLFPESNVINGKCLTIGGSHQINKLNADSYYGDLSAVVLQNMPFYTHLMRAPNLQVALMEKWEEKLEAIIDDVFHEDISYIAGVPTWTLILIKRILEKAQTNNLLDVWPNLELYLHGGVSFQPYEAQFKSIIKSDSMHYLENYNASEGFFAAQNSFDDNGMLLFLNHGIFYEFMPTEEYGKEDPETIQLRDVEIGKNYAIVISTNSGLWRYLVGDTIQFVSKYPFKIKVTGRLKHFINAFGEELIIDNSDFAINKACAATGAKVNDYCAAPIYMGDQNTGGHEWIIEFEHLPVSLEEFTRHLDKYLKETNSDYEAKRQNDLALKMPIVHKMQIGGFTEWLKSKGKLGGQNKVPRLSNERKYIEEILTWLR